MKVSSRDILDILRRFELADDNNTPRNVDGIKTVHPKLTNTLTSFTFLKTKFYILFDETADDELDYIISVIRQTKPDICGELLTNPTDSSKTYGLPFKGKDCYLFEEKSNKQRLDSVLSVKYPNTSRSTWQKYIKSGFVTVNNQVVDSQKQEVIDTDEIIVNLPETTDYNSHELPIIFLDDNVIVINKPIGVLSHSKGALNDEFTVAEFFKRYTTYNIDTNRPGIVHRLDRDTSGVMIGARNPETAKMLQKQFASRKTKKVYLAVLNGIPKLDKANIDLPIDRNPTKPSTFRVDGNGRSANTYYEVIDINDKLSLVKLMPKTGRTHQLRVHMGYIGTSILGDRVYGKQSDRLYLHAYSLEVTIPDGQRKIFTAPIPDDFFKLFPKAKL